MRTLGILLLSSCAWGQQWMGHSSGYVYFGFTGFGQPGGPNIFTTALSSDGITWENSGGSWSDYVTKPASGTREPYQINAPDMMYLSGTIYVHVATANDENLDLVPWIVATADPTTGQLTTIASVDWSSAIPGLTSCYAGGWARNSDGTVYQGDGFIHLHVPCSVGNLSSFKIYETHADPSDLTSWSAPVDIQVAQSDTIDPQAYLISGTYFLWCKQDSSDFVTLASSSSITGPFTMLKTGDWAGWGSGNEGPFMYRPPNGIGWYLMFEHHVSTHLMYYATCSTDDPSACTWSGKTLWTEDLVYRHGAVMKLNP